MSDPFVAEIRIFAGNFAPKGWAFCNGQLMPISQNTALFSLLGTIYGGDGKSTFALPDLQGRAPMHPGQGPGLSLHDLGESAGSETVTLLETEMPAHGHNVATTQSRFTLGSPGGNALTGSRNASTYQTNTGSNLVAMNPAAVGPSGGSLPHNNRQPYLTLNFIIALQGIFPPRS